MRMCQDVFQDELKLTLKSPGNRENEMFFNSEERRKPIAIKQIENVLLGVRMKRQCEGEILQ